MRHTRLRPAAGPIALVGTILGWVLTLNLGFALIYCSLGSQRLLVAPGPGRLGAAHACMRGLYVSLGAFDTIRYDIAPARRAASRRKRRWQPQSNSYSRSSRTGRSGRI